MGETASGTLSIPIRVIVEGQGSTREEILRLLKEDETVQQAVRSLQVNNSTSPTPLSLPAAPQTSMFENAVLPKPRTFFVSGWNLFQKYRKLDETIREQFAHVFQHDEDFEAFICCGAQQNAPEEIWDGMKRCLSMNPPPDLTLLKEILSYAIDLVNRTFPLPTLHLTKVQRGESYNDSLHSIYGDSKKQGEVAQVFLQGIVRGNECIRKCLIRLG